MLPSQVIFEVVVAPHDPLVLVICTFAESHAPKADWQPEPQNVELFPQRPWEEQQLPKPEVRQVALTDEFLPQRLLVLAGWAVGSDVRSRFARCWKKLWKLVVNMTWGRGGAYGMLRSKTEAWVIKIMERRNTPSNSIFNGAI